MEKIANIKHIRQWFPETDEMLAKRGKCPEMPIKTILTLNNFLWGLHKQEMTIIGARPSNCKSILAIQLAWDQAVQGRSVYFMSLEMAVPRIIERMFSCECLIDNMDIMRGIIKDDTVVAEKYAEFKEKMSKTRLVLSDMIGRTAQDLGEIEKVFNNYPDVIIIDHLNEVSSEQSKSVAIEQYLGKIREMAIRKNVALVLCCQVNRSVRTEEDKTPQLHQLKSSGSIEEKADNVVLLHYPYIYDKEANINTLEIHIAKNRYGAIGHGKVFLHPQYSRISDDGNVFKSTRVDRERREESNIPNANVREPEESSGNIEDKVVKPEDIIWEDEG